jgi:N utilization substance protein A
MTVKDLEVKHQAETHNSIETFVIYLGLEKGLASLLVESGLSSLEEIAYLPIKELMEITKLDKEKVNLLRDRSKTALVTLAAKKEENIENKKYAEDLIKNLPGLEKSIAFQLVAHGILTLEDLAEQGHQSPSNRQCLVQQDLLM